MTHRVSSFSGLRVAAFESRRAAEMARLIERLGGVPRVSPSMREVAVTDHFQAVDFAHRLITGQVDVVILTTGVGTRHLLAQVEKRVDRGRFLACLADVVTVVRGPKPVAVLKELGIEPTWRAPEPNTWREILAVIDRHQSVAGQSVVVQEYGQPNPSLIAGLEARGARVTSLKIYHWDLPEETGPLEENVRAIARGEIDVVLFTSAHQVVNFLRMVESLGLGAEVRRGMRQTVVASIGPTTSEMLRECELSVDIEPQHSKMGQLVQAAAEQAGGLLAKKRRSAEVTAAAASDSAAGIAPAWQESPFMKACRLEPSDKVPIWLMRQAGRYLPEYRRVRERTTFLELCKNPALSAEVMIAAVHRLGGDAAIIFSDLLPILEPMGMELEYAEGEGPLIHNPVRQGDDIDRVAELERLDDLDFVMETVRLTRAGLPEEIPLIGFAGAPFTLASYTVEGGASRSFLHTKTLMYRDEGAWRALMERLARAVTLYLNAQIAAGAQAVQLFDSWVGCLGPGDYRRYVLPYTQSVIRQLSSGVPVIHFATGNPALIPLMAEAGGSVIGVDWRIQLADAWRAAGYDRGMQGNLDPLVLLAEPSEIRRRVLEILQQAAGRAGHIFNLGHGVLPQTPVENAVALVDAVHELGPQRDDH